MSGHFSSFYLLLFCIGACMGLLLWTSRGSRHFKNKNVGPCLVGAQIVLVLAMVSFGFYSYLRHERLVRIETAQEMGAARLSAAKKHLDLVISTRLTLQGKMNALTVAEAMAEASGDENTRSAMQERRSELFLELNQLARQSADLQREIVAIRNAYANLRKDLRLGD